MQFLTFYSATMTPMQILQCPSLQFEENLVVDRPYVNGGQDSGKVNAFKKIQHNILEKYNPWK